MLAHVPENSPFFSGLKCLCSRCGRGSLFARFLKISRQCSNCNLGFSDAESGDGLALFIVRILGIIIVGSTLLLKVHFGSSLWAHLLIWVSSALVGALVLLRSCTLLIALQYYYPSGLDKDVD